MGCDYYSVMYSNIPLAQHMTLENALIFIEALFQKFFEEDDISYSIKREPPEPFGGLEQNTEAK